MIEKNTEPIVILYLLMLICMSTWYVNYGSPQRSWLKTFYYFNRNIYGNLKIKLLRWSLSLTRRLTVTGMSHIYLHHVNSVRKAACNAILWLKTKQLSKLIYLVKTSFEKRLLITLYWEQDSFFKDKNKSQDLGKNSWNEFILRKQRNQMYVIMTL